MKKAAIVVSRDYDNNKLFDLSNPFLNRDNCLRPFYLLKERFKVKGYDLCTQDINPIDSSEIVIYNEMPKDLSSIEKSKSYLLIFESEIIRPDNWNLDNHKLFQKVFTWNDRLVDQKFYFKMNFPNNVHSTKPEDHYREKLVTLISGNKSARHPKELYSKRLETIKWLDKHHPERFDFYGMGWDQINFGPTFLGKILRKLQVSKLIPIKKFKTYRGKVENKHETFKKYDFAICYENGRDITGYITEKIFDCLFAGTIPIYWGADNIKDHVPENCFIDRTIFKSHEELYSHINNMSNEERNEYQKNIFNFLNSDQIYAFSADYFADKISQVIINE